MTPILGLGIACTSFQLTSSRRGWRSFVFLSSGILNYFNSHPHEEDDFDVYKSVNVISISTHILTKRMTASVKVLNIHYLFQLTSSRRGWRFSNFMHLTICVISTHILTKRMTKTNEEFRNNITFQLTSSRRGWLHHTAQNNNQVHFNSHPHEEDDRNLKAYTTHHEYFNSHPHEEDDRSLKLLFIDFCISTHILTKRMT